MQQLHRRTFQATPFVGALVLAALMTTGLGTARATEIIPSLGITKSTDANAGDAQGFAGVALRAPLFPFLKAEGAIGYRQETFPGLKLRQWPVSASLWLTPFPMLYAGGGLGWYRTTLAYNSNIPIGNTTSDKVGVHIGGGVDVPLGPQLALDMNGRYIFMKQDQASLAIPTTFNPDYWNLTLGLAVRF